MVQVFSRQTQASGKQRIVIITLRLFLPCLLLLAFLDVRILRLLRFRIHVQGATDTFAATTDTPSKVTAEEEGASNSVKNPIEVSTADTPNMGISKENNKQTSKTTTTTCLDPQGPQPYILLARGRSGSGSTLQVLGSLTGEHIPGDHEITGSSPKQAYKVFERIGPNDGGNWVLNDLCKKQRQHPKAGLVAFKWKPYGDAMFSPATIAGLDLISRAVDPKIKIVRLRRNLLDNFISDRKHENAKLLSHCRAGHQRCIKKHKKAGTNLTLSVTDLLAFLESETNQEDTVDKFLVNMSVPHVQVSYEKLYHQDNAEEWMQIFRFLGVGPGTGLTRQQVDGVAHAFTASPHHGESIYNYDEVEKALRGTRFENLLHPCVHP